MTANNHIAPLPDIVRERPYQRDNPSDKGPAEEDIEHEDRRRIVVSAAKRIKRRYKIDLQREHD